MYLNKKTQRQGGIRLKDFYIEVPVLVKLMVGVKAENEEEAKEKLFDADLSLSIEDKGDETEWLDYEWEMLEKVVQGNIYLGDINEISIEEEY
jgi:hypothetical protein